MSDGDQPKPGSDEAIASGCTCPVMDNGHGRGFMGMTGVFVYNVDCRFHNPRYDDGEAAVPGIDTRSQSAAQREVAT